MNVLLDGTPLCDAPASVVEAIDAGRRQAEALGRVIVSVEVDGAPWTPDGHDSALPMPSHGREVSMTTEDPESLVRQTLLGIADLLRSSAPGHREAATLIQAGKLGEGLQELGRTINAWETARRGMDESAALLGVSIEELLARTGACHQPPDRHAPSPSRSIRELEETLQEVKRAMQDRDWSGLSDVLEYELPERSTMWERLLRTAAGAIRLGERQ